MYFIINFDAGISSEKHPNGKYNLGNGQGFTNLKVLRTVEKVIGEKIDFKMDSLWPDNQLF